MKRVTQRTTLVMAVAGALAVLIPAGPAVAMNRTDCGNRTDFVKVWYNGGKNTVCFANAGVQDVDLPNAVKVSSGNNRIRFVVGGDIYTMDKWATKVDVEGQNRKLTRLRIF
ncbi:hypothetical protein OG790_05755 [Streptomyces cellulosae]